MAEAGCADDKIKSTRPGGAAKSRFELTEQQELAVALVLTAFVVLLHVVRAFNAGGLWRDEAASAYLATACSISEVVHNSQYELFPVLLPELLRVYSLLAGHSDSALRIFGMLVGLGIIATLWCNMHWIRRGVPMLSLALLGFNGAIVQWGDAIRGYGLGILFLLLTMGLLWRVVENPTAERVLAAAASAICSVQSLFNNSALLLAVCLGAMTLALARRSSQRALVVLGIGMAAAASLLPYLRPLSRVRDWDMLVRARVGLSGLWQRLNEAFSASGPWNGCIWVTLFLAGVVILMHGWLKRYVRREKRRTNDTLAFAGVPLLIGTVGYIILMLIVGYPTQPWYYLTLISMIAVCLDLLVDSLRRRPWIRTARLVVAVLIALAAVVPTWQHAKVRQSNVDKVAKKIQQLANPEDLVLVSPWYIGVSFNRYSGTITNWTTIPQLAFHGFHRYDLLKEKMILPDQSEPVRPIQDRIAATLKQGHRVWVVGEMRLFKGDETVPTLGPAPDETWGWQDEAWSIMWTAKTTAYLQFCSKQMQEIEVSPNKTVNRFENLALRQFEGWTGL